MGLHKAISAGRERRRPYRGSRAWDRTCRNHGSCGYCRGARTYQRRRVELTARQEAAEVEAAQRTEPARESLDEDEEE